MCIYICISVCVLRNIHIMTVVNSPLWEIQALLVRSDFVAETHVQRYKYLNPRLCEIMASRALVTGFAQ